MVLLLDLRRVPLTYLGELCRRSDLLLCTACETRYWVYDGGKYYRLPPRNQQPRRDRRGSNLVQVDVLQLFVFLVLVVSSSTLTGGLSCGTLLFLLFLLFVLILLVFDILLLIFVGAIHF